MRWLTAALLLVGATASAGGRVAEIRARGALIVSVKNDAQRPHHDPAHAEKRGFELELTRVIARRLLGDDARVDLRLVPRPARLPLLASGTVDLVVSMIPMTPENARQCELSHPYFSSGLSLLVREGAHPVALADLAQKTIAFRKQSYNDYGAALVRLAGERGVTLAVRYYPTLDAAVAAVARGEAAAVGGNFVDLEAYRRGHAQLAVDRAIFDERGVAVAVKRGEPELLAVVNQVIDDLKRSGELKRMTEKWHLPYLLPSD